jgi:hypothetical protein
MENKCYTWEEAKALPVGFKGWMEERDQDFRSGPCRVGDGSNRNYGHKILFVFDEPEYTLAGWHYSYDDGSDIAWRIWDKQPNPEDLERVPWSPPEEDSPRKKH